MSSLYFDNNATTQLHSEVHGVMLDCLKTQFGNPSSNHSFGRKAHELVEESRDKVARSIGALPQEVFFTSSGTESNNWFVSGISSVYPDAHFYYGATEHPCILKPMQKLKNVKTTLISVLPASLMLASFHVAAIVQQKLFF